MIQYLHSMESRIESGGMNPSDTERVSQTVGQKQRVGFVPALPCQESRFKKKQQQQKDLGEGSQLVLHP